MPPGAPVILMKSFLRLLLFLTLPLFVADQVTKWMVVQNIRTDEPLPVIPGFLNFVQVYNTGAAFGILRDSNAFFIVLASAALVVIAVLAARGAFAGTLLRVGAALLVAGVLGNLADRIFRGYVMDFLDVILPWYGHWPAFNIADSCICLAAGLFILESFLPKKPPAPEEK
ncbi:MAG: signal peptidase II [Verrucomicrobiae bacterium]